MGGYPPHILSTRGFGEMEFPVTLHDLLEFPLYWFSAGHQTDFISAARILEAKVWYAFEAKI